MNRGWIYREQVNRADAGKSILGYYTDKYPHSSREEWQEKIADGQILLEGKPVIAQTLIKSGQWLTYHRPPWEEPEVPLSFEILYEDEDLLIIAKPAGLPVLPGGGFLENTLIWLLQQCYPQEKPVPIHRLGRGTSGLMLIARSPFARIKLSQQMRDYQITKTYRALVGNSNLNNSFRITQPIGKISHPILGYIYAATPEGKFAQSDCRVLKRTHKTTLLEVTILTGRPHQIRIHLASIGYPLIGDTLYSIGGIPQSIETISGDKIPVPGDCGYHLHAYHLTFCHPQNGELISIICPPPLELNGN